MTAALEIHTTLTGEPPFPAQCPVTPAGKGPGYRTDLEGPELRVVLGWKFAVPIDGLVDGPHWYTDEFWTTFDCEFGDKLELLLRERLASENAPEWWSAMVEEAWEHAAGAMRDFGTVAEAKQINEERRRKAEVGA
jgi:hypothetical protein